MRDIQGLTDRYAPIEAWPTCVIRIKRGDKWYQMRLLEAPLEHCKTVISRLRRKGREVHITCFTGMGLESFEDHTEELLESKND